MEFKFWSNCNTPFRFQDSDEIAAFLRYCGIINSHDEKISNQVGQPGACAPYDGPNGEKLYPHGAVWGPIQVRNLEQGETKLWCTCGLSRKQPWCDGSHKGTDFKPLKWKVPGTLKDGSAQTVYSLCGCKYTKAPPYCDANHIHVPCEVLERMESCRRTADVHNKEHKMCGGCGWAADW